MDKNLRSITIWTMPKEILTTISATQALNLAKQIREAADTLHGIALLIQEEEFDELTVSRWRQTSDGVDYIETFISTLRLALKKARQDRGDFPPSTSQRRRKGVSDSANGST
jgi:hypothetical protein